MGKHLFNHFRIFNLNLKNIKLHFGLLTRPRLILETQLHPWPIPLWGHQEKTSLFFLVTHEMKLSLRYNEVLF